LARLRLLVAFLLASGVAVGLFWSLKSLIGVAGDFDAIAAAPKIDFVRLRVESEAEPKKRAKPQIEKPPPPPTAPAVMTAQKASVAPGADLVALAPSVDYSGLGGGGTGGGGGGGALALAAGVDRDVVPQVRIQPDYPIQARQKRIEGWVDVRFTVAADGSVRDPVVVKAEPASIFDRAAVQAVRGWKYNPKVQDGRPVERPGVVVRIRFTLDQLES
jgi:protein TonB